MIAYTNARTGTDTDDPDPDPYSEARRNFIDVARKQMGLQPLHPSEM